MAKQAVGGLSQRQVEELESVQLAVQANALAEMEHSHNASQRQLLAEMDAIRQHKAAAEERAIRADHLVRSYRIPWIVIQQLRSDRNADPVDYMSLTADDSCKEIFAEHYFCAQQSAGPA